MWSAPCGVKRMNSHDTSSTRNSATMQPSPGASTMPLTVLITPLQTTARYGYFRLRDEGYQDADIARWADTVAAQTPHWDDAFVYFKHEDEGKGPAFAAAFVEQLRARGITTA